MIHSMLLMEIEQFIAKSEGEWDSMRSGHSLAFRQFEEVLSKIKIVILKNDDSRVNTFLAKSEYYDKKAISPFEIKWEGNSDWSDSNAKKELSGSSILLPIPLTKTNGIILRSQGYAEKIEAKSEYYFLKDGTIVLSTSYEQTMAKEKIWFINENVRCRSSVISSLNSKSILQTSFASEIRKISC